MYQRKPSLRIVVPLAVLAVTAGVAAAAGFGGSPTSDSQHEPTGAAPPATMNVPAPHSGAAAILDQLTVTDEDTGAHYNRDDWSNGWNTHKGGCSTRELVLLHQAPTAQRGPKCAPYCPTDEATPCWASPYDAATFRDPRGLQIDHIVPLKEANRSRLRGSGPAGQSALSAGRVWSAAEKHAFAEDQENLVAVTASVNEAKGDLDPGRWKPADHSQWCWYGRAYTHIKAQYGLSVDPAELAGLRQLIATCTADDHNQPGAAR